MAINQDRYNRKKSEMQRKGGGGLFRLKEGKNVIRVFLFEHTATQHDFDIGTYKKGDGVKIGARQVELDREVPKHFFEDGHGVCSGKRDCPACADARVLLKSGSKGDKKAGKMLFPRIMHHVNGMDMNAIDEGIQLMSLPKTAFEPILDTFLDPEDGGEACFGPTGVDFIITYDKSKQPSEMYSVRMRERSKSEKLDKDLADKVIDLLADETLDPGYNMDKYEREFGDDDTDADEPKEEKKQRKAPPVEKLPEDEDDADEGKPIGKASKPKKEEDEDLTDDEPKEEKGKKGTDDLKALLKKRVTFKDGKNEVEGTVVAIEKDLLVVKDADGEEWNVEIEEIKVLEGDGGKQRRRPGK